MSDVVVTVVESNTNVTVTEQDVAVAVTETTVEVSAATAGIQGNPGANNDPVYVTVRNATGALITKGSIVYVSGGNGTHTQVTKAIATGDSTSARTLGWLADDIANNADGLCMVEGYLDGVDTQGVTEGSQLYLSGTVAGAYQVAKPVAPIHLVYVGVCVKASAGNGRVYVKVQNGYELSEIHDVLIVSPTNNQVLAYDSATQLWKNATNAPDGVTSITATAPLTGGTITSTGSIGLDQTALSITKSQVSDFTSGTVTSASTAQQAGTAVFATTSGTATYATTSGTAVFATNASTAVTISGSITKSQVSDFTSGTVTSASTAQQAGTAVFADTSGTATYATTSGTATYADTSGTALFATNASTAVTISGSITQSQVTNLVTDLAGKANLAGGNAFTGAQTVSGTATASVVATVTGASGQNTDIFRITNSTPTTLFAVSQFGRTNISGSTFITPTGASEVVATVRGASGQTADLLQLQNSSGTILSLVNSSGSFRVASIGAIAAGNAALTPGGDTNGFLLATVNAGNKGLSIRGAASQSSSLQEWQNSAGTVLAKVGNSGRIDAAQFGSTTSAQAVMTPGSDNGSFLINTAVATNKGLLVRGFTSQSANALEIQTSDGVANTSMTVYGGITSRLSGSYPGVWSVGTGTASTIGLVVRGSASQSANLQEWQNSAGTIRARIDQDGQFFNTFGIMIGGATNYGSTLNVLTQGAANIGAIIRGSASQTANLQEWQNSAGTVLAKIESTGVIFANNFRTNNQFAQMVEENSGGRITLFRGSAVATNPGANALKLYVRDGTNAGTLKLVVRAGAAGAETTILDNIPQ